MVGCERTGEQDHDPEKQRSDPDPNDQAEDLVPGHLKREAPRPDSRATCLIDPGPEGARPALGTTDIDRVPLRRGRPASVV
jgi:hypothetical protein